MLVYTAALLLSPLPAVPCGVAHHAHLRAGPARGLIRAPLSRARGRGGGLRALSRDEREFPQFQSHGIDPFELQGGREPAERRLRPVLGSCVACHFRPGIHSVLSRVPDMTELRLRGARRDLVPAPSHAREADITKA